MTIDWMAVLNGGFLTFFGVFVLFMFWKAGPAFIRVWQEFAKSIQNLSDSVADNTVVTKRQYEESMSVKEQLKSLNDKLKSRDETFDRHAKEHSEMLQVNREDHRETRLLLEEINKKVNTFLGEDKK